MSICWKVGFDAGMERFLGVHDLNCGVLVCGAFGSDGYGGAYERRQDIVRASHGVRAVEGFRTHRRAAPRRCRGPHSGLRRFVSHPGFRPAHMARVAARYRGLPGGQPVQAVPHGAEDATRSLDAGRCVEPARLAHLSWLGPAADCPRQGVVCPGTFAAGTRCQCLRAGLDYHRSVPEPVRLGAVSFEQGGHQAAYSAGPARRVYSRSSTSATASCTMPTCSTCCRSKRAAST